MCREDVGQALVTLKCLVCAAAAQFDTLCGEACLPGWPIGFAEHNRMRHSVIRDDRALFCTS
jgi:hypothetical protein